jgi:hypothetical protein
VQVTPKGWWFLNIARFERSHRWGLQTRSVTYTVDCHQMIVYDGDPVGGVYPGTPHSGQLHSYWGQRPLAPARVTLGDIEWFWNTEWEMRWFDPPKFLPDVQAIVGPTMFSGDYLRIETEWLENMPGVKSAQILVDHQPLKHNQLIEIADLNAGHHLVDLEWETDEGSRHIQASFATKEKVEVVLDSPVAEVEITSDSDKPNGTAVGFTVRNNTPLEQPAIVSVSSVPEGWMAVIEDFRPFRLGPHEERRMTLQVEMMSDLGVADAGQHLPFTLSYTCRVLDVMRGQAQAQHAHGRTLYVRPQFEKAFAARLRKSKRVHGRNKPLVG